MILSNSSGFAQLLRGPSLSFLSQATGLLQFVLILYSVGAGTHSDTYFYCFSLGAIPGQILFTGLLYPRMLNRRQIVAMRYQTLFRVALIASGLAVVASGLWIITIRRQGTVDLFLLVALLAVNAVLQSALLYRATLAAVDGRPAWVAGLALPSNIAAILGLAIALLSRTSPLVVMATAMICGNMVHLIFSLRQQPISLESLVIAADAEHSHGTDATTTKGGGGWYFARSIVSYTSQALLQSAAATLSAASVTNLSIATKMATVVPTTVVNATFPKVVNARTSSGAPGRVLGRRILAGATIAAILAGAVALLTLQVSITLAAGIGLWAIASTSSATGQYMSFRFLSPRYSLASISANILMVGLSYGLLLSGRLTVAVILVAFVFIDGINALTVHGILGDRMQAAWIAIVLLVSLWILFA